MAQSSQPMSVRLNHALGTLAWASVTSFPLLAVLREHPAFIAAHGTAWGDAVVAFLVVWILCPLLLHIAVVCLAFPIATERRFLASLVVVAGLTLMKAIGLAMSIPLGLLIGYGLYKELQENETARKILLTVLFLYWMYSGAAFWANSGVRKGLEMNSPTGEKVERVVESDVPIIFLLFDEFPTTIIMDDTGSIEEEHFPNFSKLAETSTWYRAAHSESLSTEVSVPQLVSGRREPEPGQCFIPLFFGTHDVHVVDFLLNISPATRQFDGPRLASFLRDLSYVWIQLYLPESLAKHFPDVSASWAGYGNQERRWQVAIDELSGLQPSGGKPPLLYLHTFLPHRPYRYRNDSSFTTVPILTEEAEPDKRGIFSIFFLQTKSTDTLLGEAIEILKAKELWDRSYVIVTADHGRSFHPGPNRVAEGKGRYSSFFVPLFIKEPGQNFGRKVDSDVSLLDVIPTLFKGLGVTIPWPVDGKDANSEQPTSTDLEGLKAAAREKYEWHDLNGPGSVFCESVAASWWGRSVPTEVEGVVPGLRFTHINSASFENLNVGSMPLEATFEFEGESSSDSVLVLTINGVVVASRPAPSSTSKFYLSFPFDRTHLQQGPMDFQIFRLSSEHPQDWLKILPKEAVVWTIDESGQFLKGGARKYEVVPDDGGVLTGIPVEDLGYRLFLYGADRNWEWLLLFDENGDLVHQFEPPHGGQAFLILPKTEEGEKRKLKPFYVSNGKAHPMRLELRSGEG